MTTQTLTLAARDARSVVRALIWWGLAILVAGVVLAGLTMPGTEPVLDEATLTMGTQATGDETGFALGLLVTAAGWTMMGVGLTAWAVALGIRSART